MNEQADGQDPLVVHVEGELDDETVHRVKMQLRATYGAKVRFAPGRVSLGFDVDWQTVGTLAGLVIGSVGLLLQVATTKRAPDEWTKARLDEIIQTELFRYDIQGTSLPSIRGFQNLLSGAAEPCVVELADPPNAQLIRIFVRRDGSAYTLRTAVEPIR